MNQDNTNGLRKILDDLSTDQLKQLLDEELQKENSDPASVKLLLAVLEERHAEEPKPVSSVSEEARQRYQERMEELFPPEPKKAWKPLLKVASVLLVCVVLFSPLLPQKAEAESFWEILQRLSNTVIEFFGREDVVIETVNTFETDNAGLQQVFDTAVEMGIENPMMPMWLMEARLQDIQTGQSPTVTALWASFLDGDTEIVYTLNVYEKEIKRRYYRDDSFYDSYEHNGVTYTISKNNSLWTAVWRKENVECSIFIDCQEETLRRILKSVYVMEE